MVATGHSHGRWQQAIAWLVGILIVLLFVSGCQQQVTWSSPASQPRPVIEPTATSMDQVAEDQAAPSDIPDAVIEPPSVVIASPVKNQDVIWSVGEPVEMSASPREQPETTPVAAPTPDAPILAEPQPELKPQPPAIASDTAATELDTLDTRPMAETPQPAPAPEVSETADAPEIASKSSAQLEQPQPLPMFYVFGEVAKPGPYKHTGRNRVLDMLAQVQPTRRANPAQVLLVRPSPDQTQRQVFTIDADRMIRQGDLSQNYRLEAGDILYIPPAGLARLDATIEQLLTDSASPASHTSASRPR